MKVYVCPICQCEDDFAPFDTCPQCGREMQGTCIERDTFFIAVSGDVYVREDHLQAYMDGSRDDAEIVVLPRSEHSRIGDRIYFHFSPGYDNEEWPRFEATQTIETNWFLHHGKTPVTRDGNWLRFGTYATLNIEDYCPTASRWLRDAGTTIQDFARLCTTSPGTEDLLIWLQLADNPGGSTVEELAARYDKSHRKLYMITRRDTPGWVFAIPAELLLEALESGRRSIVPGYEPRYTFAPAGTLIWDIPITEESVPLELQIIDGRVEITMDNKLLLAGNERLDVRERRIRGLLECTQ